MGYRLAISNKDKDIIFYGTKYYGYLGDFACEMIKEGSKSCAYLLRRKIIDNDEIFEYCNTRHYKLTKIQLLHFLNYYIDDLLRYGYEEDDDENNYINILKSLYNEIKKDKDEYFYISWG